MLPPVPLAPRWVCIEVVAIGEVPGGENAAVGSEKYGSPSSSSEDTMASPPWFGERLDACPPIMAGGAEPAVRGKFSAELEMLDADSSRRADTLREIGCEPAGEPIGCDSVPAESIAICAARVFAVSIGLPVPGGRVAPGKLGGLLVGDREAKYPVVAIGEAEMLPCVVVEKTEVYVPWCAGSPLASCRAGMAILFVKVLVASGVGGLSSPESLRRAELMKDTQSSISAWDEALARKVRFEVTMPKVNECFLTVTGATV
jgi:hypothetical protein